MLYRPTITLKELSFLKVSRFFLALFLICFPFQIRSLVYGGPMFLTGNFNPYTSFFIHLSDLFILAAFIAWGGAMVGGEISHRLDAGQRKMTLLVVAFLMTAAFVIFFAQDPLVSFFMVTRLILFFLLYVLFANEVMERDDVIKYFLGGMLLQTGIAVWQYFSQQSVGFRFLGESEISPSISGVAKIDINGSKVLRAYGTFPHANILGGAAFMAVLLCFNRMRGKLWLAVPLLAVFLMALILTFSRSAFFALVAAFLIYISINEGRLALRYVLLAFSVLLFFIVSLNLEGLFFQRFLFSDTESGLARLQYMSISKGMFFEHPFGVGLGGFTEMMQNYTADKLEPWLFQPVHNVFLLAANELGLVGGILFLSIPGYLFYLLIRKVMGLAADSPEKQFGQILIAMLAGITTIALFDHYFITIYQGQALIFIYLGLATAYLKDAGPTAQKIHAEKSAYLKKPGLPRRKS